MRKIFSDFLSLDRAKAWSFYASLLLFLAVFYLNERWHNYSGNDTHYFRDGVTTMPQDWFVYFYCQNANWILISLAFLAACMRFTVWHISMFVVFWFYRIAIAYQFLENNNTDYTTLKVIYYSCLWIDIAIGAIFTIIFIGNKKNELAN